MSRVSLLAAFAAFSLFAGSASAGDPCSGDPGYRLGLDDTIRIGDTFHMTVEAPKGDAVFVLISAGDGPSPTPFGSLCLDLPPIGVFAFVMPNCDKVSFPHDVPCNDDLVGLTGYFQFISINRQTGKGGRSNMEQITVKDGNCGCDDDDSSDDDRSDDHSSDDCSSDDDRDSHDDHGSDDCSSDDDRDSRDDHGSDDCSDDDRSDDR